MAILAIGDIHGMFESLKIIFEQKFIHHDDTIIFLGDYVDRGPNTKSTIDWLIENSSRYNFIFLKGNHEEMMLRAKINREHLLNWLQYGGEQTLDSYGIGDDPNWQELIDESHWKFLENCELYYEIRDFIFVHAGLEPELPLVKQDTLNLLWRKFETPKQYIHGKRVICGHTSRKNGQIANFKHTICIDTYAYGGQWLTCLNVESGSYLKSKSNGEIIQGKLK